MNNKALRVAIMMASERSSINAALSIANALGESGHHVAFLGPLPDDLRRHVQEQGYGHTRLTKAPPLPRFSWWRPFYSLRAARRAERERLEHYRRELSAHGFDLVFIEPFMSPTVVAAWASTNVPTLLIRANYASYRNALVPPISSSLTAPVTLGGARRILHRLLWFRIRLGQLLARGRLREAILYPEAARWIRARGWTMCYDEYGEGPYLPEVVVGHRDVDWPALANWERRTYFVERHAARVDSKVEWMTQLAPAAPLFYCGTSTTFLMERCVSPSSSAGAPRLTRWGRAFLAYASVLMEVFRARPDWQGIVSCGGAAGLIASHLVPANLRFFDFVPQLDVLARADAAVIFGGQGTLRECVSLGVPMVVCLRERDLSDQCGNAARIRFNNLGVQVRMKNLRSSSLMHAMQQVLTDAGVREQVAAMQARVRALGPETSLSEFIARHTGIDPRLSQRDSSPTARLGGRPS